MTEDLYYECPKHGRTLWCKCMAADPSLVPDAIAQAFLDGMANDRG